MRREDVQKLLGGYAAGTLTPEEQQALCEAALNDQDLFDAMAREQPLRDLLRDPAARAKLLAGLEEPAEPWGRRAAQWIMGRAVGLAAIACVFVAGGYIAWQLRSPAERVRVVAVQPTTVEVAESAGQGGPKRTFDYATTRRKAARPEISTPPALQPLATAMPATLPAAIQPALPQAPPPPSEALAAVLSAPAAPTDAAAGATESAGAEAGARALFLNRGGVAVTAPLSRVSDRPAATPGVRYRILRKSPGGAFTEIPAGAALAAGDRIQLRFEANREGYLHIAEAGSAGGARPLAPVTRLERMRPFTTPEIALRERGRKEFYVLFTSERAAANRAASGDSNALRPLGLRSETNASEGATYVVNTTANSRFVMPFTIVLDVK